MMPSLRTIATTLAAVILAGPAAAGMIVFEAEHCTGLRPNLEIHAAEGASGGLAVGTFEGGGGDHTWLGGRNSSIDIGTGDYPFRLSSAGSYVVWVRAWWADKCGNSILLAVDGRGRHAAGDEHGEDHVFRTWHWCPSDPFTLAAGEHVLNMTAKEDDVRLDQWAIAPVGTSPRGVAALEANYVPVGRAGGDGLDLSLWRRSEVVDGNGRIKLKAYIRRSTTAVAKVRLKVDAGEKGATVSPGAEFDVDLPRGEALVAAPITVTYRRGGPRSEKLLRVKLISGDAEMAERAIVVTRPWRWRVLGPLRPDADLAGALANGMKPGLDRAFGGIGLKGGQAKWREPVGAKLFNRYGTVDLERCFGPTVGASAYLYAEIHSPREQKLLALLNNDDAAWTWLNGELLHHDPGGHPAEGYLWRKHATLRKGVNRILVRITQSGYPKPRSGMQSPNYWLYRLRLRGSPHRPADIRGAD